MMDNLIPVLPSLLESNHRPVPEQSDLWPGYIPQYLNSGIMPLCHWQ